MAGGQADQEVINSAEVYNPELNQWEHMVARMITPRVGLALVSMGNLIYAIGKVEASVTFPFRKDTHHLANDCTSLKARAHMAFYGR